LLPQRSFPYVVGRLEAFGSVGRVKGEVERMRRKTNGEEGT
jgi:hypothetical protein